MLHLLRSCYQFFSMFVRIYLACDWYQSNFIFKCILNVCRVSWTGALRTRQIIRYRAIASLWRTQIKQYTAPKLGGGGGVYKTNGNIIWFWQRMKWCTRRPFRKMIPHDESTRYYAGQSILIWVCEYKLLWRLACPDVCRVSGKCQTEQEVADNRSYLNTITDIPQVCSS